jgi:hypothetical protein
MAEEPSFVPITFGLDESNGHALVVTAAIFLVLSWISVLLRGYVRAIMTRSFQLDDWLMLASQVVFTLSCSFILVGVKEGMGRHNVALPVNREIPALKVSANSLATLFCFLPVLLTSTWHNVSSRPWLLLRTC